jgi:hypothetical protein
VEALEEKSYWSREMLSAEFVKALNSAQNYFWRALKITTSFSRIFVTVWSNESLFLTLIRKKQVYIKNCIDHC